MFQSVPCHETVSILRAIVLGANGACVELSLWSVLSALVPFVAVVVLLQWVLKRAVFGRSGPAVRTGTDRQAPLKAGQRRSQELGKTESD